jgi:hypothetical protein
MVKLTRVPTKYNGNVVLIRIKEDREENGFLYKNKNQEEW